MLVAYCYECTTYSSTCCSYRSSDEVKAVRKDKDAIKLVEAYALNGQLATAEELKVPHGQ